jgi:hypothetical protein
MPESPRSKLGRYIFIVMGCAIVVGALYYVVKGALSAPRPAPASSTSSTGE